MILIIRISGMVNMTEKMQETLYRIKLRRKYAAVLLQPTTNNIGLLKRIRNHVAYGNINRETLIELIKKRAQPKDKSKKINQEKVLEQLEKGNLGSLDIKPFFRLHPPRGGIDAKNHFNTSKKAVLGDNKEKINELVRRML